jgi:hypothetical protein
MRKENAQRRNDAHLPIAQAGADLLGQRERSLFAFGHRHRPPGAVGV